MTLKEQASRAVEELRRKAPGLEGEVYLYRGSTRSLELRQGLPHIQRCCEESGVGLRLFQDGRMGFASAGGSAQDVLPGLIESVRSQLPHLPRDEHRVLPALQAGSAGSIEGLEDPVLMSAPLSEWEERLRAMEAAALSEDKCVKKVLDAGYGEGRAECAMAGTTGLLCIERATHCNAGIAILAEQEGEVQVGSGSCMARSAAGIDLTLAAKQAVQRGAALLGGVRESPRRRTVLFDPWAAGELLDLLAGALSAEAVQKGHSLFAGKRGKRIASECVSLIDDPRRPFGISSSLYDDEGVPTRRKDMVLCGVLQDFFYDDYTARREGRASNASASRPGYKGLPGPGATNFYLEPGKFKREELFKDAQDGVLVLDLLGMHTADAVSGEFSVGISALLLQGGELGRPLKAAMLSGNLFELLDRVDAVADDLTFHGSLAAPTFRVRDLMVA
ncbi:MAG: TldD/PmbA family protein [Elusimicrobiota bacterium]|jgi:PmbA protein